MIRGLSWPCKEASIGTTNRSMGANNKLGGLKEASIGTANRSMGANYKPRVPNNLGGVSITWRSLSSLLSHSIRGKQILRAPGVCEREMRRDPCASPYELRAAVQSGSLHREHASMASIHECGFPTECTRASPISPSLGRGMRFK